MVIVEFRMAAPGARSVALAGDFTKWSPDHRLEDLNGDGVWTARVAIPPGVHTYMFVIDGSAWVTDPHAERYLDDGFGNRNAVLAVTTPSA
jgi:1,4-alpha-glucan branching enzyme